jgi:hypothetical protein
MPVVPLILPFVERTKTPQYFTINYSVSGETTGRIVASVGTEGNLGEFWGSVLIPKNTVFQNGWVWTLPDTDVEGDELVILSVNKVKETTVTRIIKHKPLFLNDDVAGWIVKTAEARIYSWNNNGGLWRIRALIISCYLGVRKL